MELLRNSLFKKKKTVINKKNKKMKIKTFKLVQQCTYYLLMSTSKLDQRVPFRVFFIDL